MVRLLYACIISYVLFSGNIVLADPPSAYAASQKCPVDVRLKEEEKRALRRFNDKMEGLLSVYGKDRFHSRLAHILENEYPDKKVIEISPAFYEHVLHYIDFVHVFNDIEMTIGKGHPLWSRTGDFRRLREKVMGSYFTPLVTWERERFDNATEGIVDAINNVSIEKLMKKRRLTEEQALALKARAVSGIIQIYMIVGQWDEVYKAIQAENQRWQRDLALEIGLFALTGFALPGGLFVWTTIKAASLMQKTARLSLAATRASGAAKVARITTMSDVVMASGLGAVGAPAGLRILDATGAVAEAMKVSRDTDTIFICHLGRQIEKLKRRGVAPYLKAAVVGGTVGAVGAGVTAISPAFASAVLKITRYGVFFAQGYSVYAFGEKTVLSIAAFADAEEAINAGNRELAREHLLRARRYAIESGDAFMNSLMLALLTTQIQGSYGEIVEKMDVAMAIAAVEIRALYASSADTLPLALENGMSAVADVKSLLEGR